MKKKAETSIAKQRLDEATKPKNDEFIPNKYWGNKDKSLGIRFLREKPKKQYESWYDLVKHQFGRGILQIDALGLELSFGDLEVREMDTESKNGTVTAENKQRKLHPKSWYGKIKQSDEQRQIERQLRRNR